MASLKRFYPLLWTIAGLAMAGVCGRMIQLRGFSIPLALGVAGSLAPLAVFAVILFARRARFDPNWWGAIVAFTGLACATLLASILTPGTGSLPILATWLVGAGGVALYSLWYSRLPAPEKTLKLGKKMPIFEVADVSGVMVSTKDMMSSPALFMFIRGNWCPLCMAQVREISKQYAKIADMGARVIVVTSQPPKEMLSLTKRFGAKLEVYADPGLRAARALGIAHPGGLPFGLEALGYAGDTVLPTVVISDHKGMIRFAKVTDNYRVRPEPSTFLPILRRLSKTAKEDLEAGRVEAPEEKKKKEFSVELPEPDPDSLDDFSL